MITKINNRLKALAILLAGVFYFGANAQTINSNYNKALADSSGADDYGMKMYVLVILKSGTNKD